MWLERGSEHPVPWGKGGKSRVGCCCCWWYWGCWGCSWGLRHGGEGKDPPRQRVLLHGGCFRTGSLGKGSLCGWQHALQLETAPPATAPWQSLGLGRCQGEGDVVVVVVVAGAPAQHTAGCRLGMVLGWFCLLGYLCLSAQSKDFPCKPPGWESPSSSPGAEGGIKETTEVGNGLVLSDTHQQGSWPQNDARIVGSGLDFLQTAPAMPAGSTCPL